MDVIGIFGPSYCGSTITAMVLDCIPGVSTIEESHQLLDNPKIAENNPIVQRVGKRFHRNLFPDWYQELGKALGATRAFVTADKSPSTYQRIGTPDKAVLPFKDPRAQIASCLRKEKMRGKNRTLDQLLKTVYNHLYPACWKFIAEHQLPAISMSLDDLADHPEGILRSLTTFLELPYDPQMLRFWEVPHLSVGGNTRAFRWHQEELATDSEWKIRFYRAFGKDDRWKTELAPEDAEKIITHPNVIDAMERLDALKVKVCEAPK